jgi:hypothetical protein
MPPTRIVAVFFLLLSSLAKCEAGEPVTPIEFRHAHITHAWRAYADVLTFGKGQTLALVDDGCKLSKPEWTATVDGVAKVLVAHDAVDGDDDPKHVGQWRMGAPIVTYWAGPMPMTDAIAKQMADGGWNLVWVTSRGAPKDADVVGHFRSQLDILQRHGLRGILSLGCVPRNPEQFKALDDPQMKAQVDAIVEGVRAHPALYAYHLIDEPNAALFPTLARMKDYLQSKDPTRLVYVNLYPIYANNKQLGTTGEPLAAYREYLRQFVKTCRPQLLSYDHYHFAVEGDRDQFFLNLAEIRQAALDADIPFMAIVQACSWTVNMRIPTGEELRWLAYTTLAYGSQGISWYVYGYPGHDGGMITPAGTYREPHIARTMGRAVLGGAPTPLYYYARELHKEFIAIAAELQPLKSLAVYHAGMLPKGAAPLPDDAAFRLDPPLPHKDCTAPVEGLIVGCFGEERSPTHALVVNLDHRTYSGAGQPRREEFLNPPPRYLVGPGRLEIFDAAASKWTAANSNRIRLRLPPGGGMLVRTAR